MTQRSCRLACIEDATAIEALQLVPGGLPRCVRRQRVAVVGAGMTGLTAALELMRAGHDVIVLEAREHPGGRVRTLRSLFANGLYAEAGAARIPETHDLTLRYVEDFGLELAAFRPADIPSIVCIEGRRYRSDQANLLAKLGCTEREQALGPAGALRYFGGRALDRLGNLSDPEWPGQDAQQFDRLTGADLFRKLGMSEGLMRFFDLGIGVLGRLSGLELLVQLESLLAANHRIVGGNDRLPRAMAAELTDRVRYGAPVVAISQSARDVRADVATPAGRKSVTADRLILAVPLPALGRIRFTPELSAEKQHAMETVGYAAVTRVFVQVGRRFWESDGVSGFAVTDHPMEIFDASFGQDMDQGVLLGYLHEDLARRIAAMGPARGAAEAIRIMAEVFPALPCEVQGTAMFSWHGVPWAKGAVILWRPGDLTDVYPRIAVPEGRIHFSGEHSSPWHAWIQGAIHSGIRAALEVVAA